MLLHGLMVLISIFFLARSALILIGWLKEPIIRTFERYGEHEALYLPLIPLLFWAGMMSLVIGGTWASATINLSFPLVTLGLALVMTALFSHQNYDIVARWHYRFVPLPRWYHELRERTTRYERRRIGYMWLRLSWRTRVLYNSDDRMFFIWADYIIMGTVMDEEDAMTTRRSES